MKLLAVAASLLLSCATGNPLLFVGVSLWAIATGGNKCSPE
jgi:hypothetical protein